MHIVSVFADINLGDPIWQFWVGVGSLVLSALAIAVTIFMAVKGRQKKLLTYEVVSNTSVINADNDIGEALKLVLDGKILTNVRLHVIKLLNAGNTAISPEDYPHPLTFKFESLKANSPPYPNPLIRCAIHRTEPEGLLPAHQLKDKLGIDKSEQFMTLEPPLLNPRQALYLKVLLRADHRDSTQMAVIGNIKEGSIKKFTPPPTRITTRVVVMGVLIAFILGLLLSNSLGLVVALAQGICAFGAVQDSGSTSFYSAAYKEAQQYNAGCPAQVAHIAVNSNSSGEGLMQLENGTLQIANSEIRSPYTDQADHQVAVIVFALVIDKSLNISSLSLAQLHNIYDGNATSWQQVDANAPDIPIKLFGRQGTSGTQTAFLKYVLNESQFSSHLQITADGSSAGIVKDVAHTRGALGYADYSDAARASGLVTILEINQVAPTAALIEQGSYPFWAIEHMYTSLNPDPLSTSFIKYVTQNLPTNGSFIHLGSMDPIVLSTHV